MKEKNKTLLNIAGILNIAEGSLFCIFKPTIIFGLFIMAIGIYFIAMSKKTIEEQYEQRVLLLVVSIANLLINIISSVLVFVTCDNLSIYKKSINGMNAPPKEKEDLNPEAKKIDLLLKLGVGMVFISGVLFATTTWSFISDIVKAIVLVILGIFFLGLSYLTGEKFKLEKSSYVYWILGMSFFLLTIIGIEFFGIFGSYLTFTGEGKYLAYFIVMAALGFFSHITYLKFKKKYLIYVTYVSYMIATHNIIMQAKPSLVFSLIILSVMNIITLIIDNKDKTIGDISNIFVYILSLLVCSNVYNEEMLILRLLATIISISNLIYLKLHTDDDALNIFGVAITYALVSTTIASIDIALTSQMLFMFIILTIYSVFNNLNNNKKILLELNNVIYTIVSLIIYAVLLEEEILLSLIVAVVYLILGAASKVETKILKRSIIFNMTLPIVIPLILFPFGDLIGLSYDLNFPYGLGVASALYCVGNYILNNKTEKLRFLIYAIISTVLCLFNSIEAGELIISLFPIVTSLYITGIFYNHRIKTYVVLPYLLFLISLFIPIAGINLLNINIVFSTIILLWIMIMCILLFNSNLLRKITEVAIVFPIFNLLSQNDLNIILENIITSILCLYLSFIIVKYFIKKNKCMWSMIGISISIIGIIFQTNIYYALYIGLLGVLVMIFGYNSKTYSKLFKFGIGIIVANIAIQLYSVWSQVHFSIYLLVIGLSIIGFVTYKELKKMDKDKEKDK